MGQRRGTGSTAIKLVALACAATLTAAAPALAAPTRPATPASNPQPVPAHPTVQDLSRLQAALADAVRQSQEAAAAAEQAAAEQADLLIARDRAAQALASARRSLGRDVRRLYIAGAADPWQQIIGVTPDLTGLATVQRSMLAVDNQVIARAAAAGRTLARLQHVADGRRRGVLARAARMEQAQERARSLLDQARAAWAHDQASQAYLRALQASLDEQAQRVAGAVAPLWDSPVGPVQPLGDQEPIVRLLESTPGDQLPAGYHPTGRIISGIASWYGPGFVGHPTSTGVPYDPERLTAAMLAVPLGTVVHVTAANGNSVNVLINDHGPYVAGRVIDLSHRAAQLLGIGLGPVTVEVLAHG